MPPEGNGGRALIVIAHGSRSDAANDEFRAVLDKLRADKLGYAHIEGAFLEAAPPALGAVIECLAQCRVAEIDVYPRFCKWGRHVSRDIPELVEDLGGRYPALPIKLLPYFGSFDGLAGVMSEHIARSATEHGRTGDQT